MTGVSAVGILCHFLHPEHLPYCGDEEGETGALRKILREERGLWRGAYSHGLGIPQAVLGWKE